MPINIQIFLFNELYSKVENIFYESRIRVNGKKILKKSARVSYRYIQCRNSVDKCVQYLLYCFIDILYVSLYSYMLEMK